jgi:AraC family transcriptional regulator
MLTETIADSPRPIPALLDPGAFPQSLSRPSAFDRILHREEGLCISHHGYADAAFRIAGFSHNCISVQLAGRARHCRRVGDRVGSGTAVAGKVFATAALTPVVWSWQGAAEMINVWITPERLSSDLGAEGGAIALVDRFCFDDPLLAQLGIALRAQSEVRRPFGQMMLAGLLSTVEAHLGQHYSTLGPPASASESGGLAPLPLKRVLDHIEAHIGEEIALEALAALAGRSVCHFLRCFKQSTGISPHRYITQRRVDQACRMLAAGDMPLVEIALACGFADQSHFGRVFRRERDLTPMAYRRKMMH